MIPTDTEIDLLATCAAAPVPLRYAATVLLARELVSRLDASGRDIRARTAPQTHPALLDLVDASTASGLAALLAARNQYRGGPDAARFYLNWGQAGSPTFPSGTIPRTSPPDRPYASVLADVVATAAQLRALTVDTMGATAFDAARAPFLTEFALRDFATRSDVASFSVGVGAKAGSTAPGAAFLLESSGRVGAGFSKLSATDTPAISVPAPGLYRWNFWGHGRSAGTANPSDVKATIKVGGSEVASVSATRASADVNETVALGVEKYLFLPGEGGTIEIDDVLTLRNGSANVETVSGILLLWQ